MNRATIAELREAPGRFLNIIKRNGIRGILAIPDYMMLKITTGLEFNEYYNYEFENKSKAFINSYLNTSHKIKYLGYLNSRDRYYIMARNKYFTHLLLNDLGIPTAKLLYHYHPGLGGSSKHFGGRHEAVKEYILNQGLKDFVIKPAEGTWGIGVMVFKGALLKGNDLFLQCWDDTEIELLKVLSDNPLIFEQKIIQTRQMSLINPSSLNSVRIFTALYPDGSVKVFEAFALFGRSNKCISNCGDSDNITATVDIKTGEMHSTVHFKAFRDVAYVSHHPDSGQQIDGVFIENWESVVYQVKEFQKSIPFIKIIGWDLALTDKGIVVIEMNDFIDNTGQIFSGHGWRKDVEDCYSSWRSNKPGNFEMPDKNTPSCL